MTHLNEFILHEYLDNALDGQTQDEVADHLSVCSTCRAELAELESLFTTLDGVTDIPLQTDLASRVVAQLAPAKSLTWLRPVIVVQAVFAFILLLGLLPTLLTMFEETSLALDEAWQTEWAITTPQLDVTSELSLWWESLAGFDLGLAVPAGLWLAVFAVALVGLFIGNGLLLVSPKLALEVGE